MADLPINYGDSGKVARDKINDSFNELAATVEGYKPQIINGVWWIGTTNTGVKAEGDSIVMKVEDGYIWYKSESNSWTKIIAVADLKGSQGNPGADGNGIASITSTKVGKTTTVTITETGGTVDTFQIQDGADGVGGDGDVKGPDRSTDGHMAVFDGATGKIIRDGGSVPTVPTKVSDLANDSGYITSSDIPTNVSDFTNDAGYITSSYHDETKQDVLTAGTNISIENNVISATGGGSDIEYVTQAEYTALLPGALTDNKHYFIYSTSGGGGWQPGVNTLLYLPLNSTDTYTDQSGNSVSITNQGVTFGTYQGVDAGIFAGNMSNGQLVVTPFDIPDNATILFWCYMTGYDQSDAHIISMKNSSSQQMVMGAYEAEGFYGKKIGDNLDSNNYATNKWVLCAFTTNGSSGKVYLKGNGINITQTGTVTSGIFTTSYFAIGNISDGSLNRHFQGGMSRIIIESKTWTDQEFSDYYDQTKGDYGIS